MRPVRRDEILDHVTWSERRQAELPRLLAIKAARRIHVGDALTFLFENTDTIRYQVQEMVRVEKMVREADIKHELETYNGLLPGPGGLAATLLIELDDPTVRAQKLREWVALPEHLYALLEDGRKVFARFDPGQRDAERLSSVQFLTFPLEGRVPVALGSDLPALTVEARLEPQQREALAEDLRG